MNSTFAPGNATRLSRPPSGKRIDKLFFGTMSLLILGTVYLGFAHSYYLAGAMRAPLPSTIIHIHAIVFSAWILLFLLQTALISIGRVNWHRKLGILGAFLAGSVVVLGLMAVIDSTRRRFSPPGLTPGRFLAIDLLETLLFGLLVAWGLCLRRDGAAHKRLILLANIDLLGPAISRWPFHFIQHFAPSTGLVVDAFLLSLILFDLATRGRIHRVTVWGSIMIFLLPLVAFQLLGPSSLWIRLTERTSLRETLLPSASKSISRISDCNSTRVPLIRSAVSITSSKVPERTRSGICVSRRQVSCGMTIARYRATRSLSKAYRSNQKVIRKSHPDNCLFRVKV
jgi:hypothetical protein